MDLARFQKCGCVVCQCEDELQCQGCGAKNCGTHTVGEIPDPVLEITTKRLYGAKTKRRTYTVTDDVHADLQRLGQGNASRGIREAVKTTNESGETK